MLDVSIRIGVLNLLGELRDVEGLAILYVTHDIASARYFADTMTVMYAGRVVESGPSLEVTDNPAHPYTQLLLDAAPDPERSGPQTIEARGSAPSLIARPRAAGSTPDAPTPCQCAPSDSHRTYRLARVMWRPAGSATPITKGRNRYPTPGNLPT